MKIESTPVPSSDGQPKHQAGLPLTILLVVWVLGLVASTAFAPFVAVSGVLFVLLGSLAGCLVTFGTSELRRATTESPLFWETAARNAWITGATGSILFFVRALSDPEMETAAMARAMALSFAPSVYGLLLGAISLVLAIRLRESRQPVPSAPTARGLESILGRSLYVVLLAWTIAHPYLGAKLPRFMPWDWVAYWPAILVVLGAALTLLWVAGTALRERIATACLALGGTIGSLLGLVSALVGFADRSLARVTSGLGFMVTACFITLIGMTLITNPNEDRRVKRGEIEAPSPWSRVAWLLFPLLSVFILVATMVLAMIPMTAKQ